MAPATSLPITINAENITVSTHTISLKTGFVLLRFTWNINVGMTLSTSSVVDDG
ncbi:hypothetical protein [Anaerostipes faecalis]|uniref:hypothetical protein n=1 Tax=Anaerostipes faecalis TaxID=2738446 RepID=UPI003F07F179